jgi:MYXO-CTERM domain-containing protein
MSCRKFLSHFLLLTVAACSTQLAEATVIPTPAFSDTQLAAFTPSATDLVNFDQATLTSRTEVGYAPFSNGGATSTANALNDGVLGPTTNSINPDLNGTAFDIDGAWQTTFTLNTTLNPLGYDITSIATIAAWMVPRADQSYTVQYTTVGNAVPQTLGAFSYPPNASGNPAVATMLTLSDSSGPGNTITGLTGVASLIFNILPPGGNNQTVYREIDVFGQPTGSPVPEPSSCLLAAMGAVGLAFLARRRREA